MNSRRNKGYHSSEKQAGKGWQILQAMRTKNNNRGKDKESDQNSSMISDFDDLIFVNRNKDYGAYVLRKKYNSVLIKCTIAAVVIVSLAVIIPFLATNKQDRVVSVGNGYVQVNMQNFEPPAEKIYVPPAPPPPPSAKVRESVEYIPPVVVDSVVPINETLPTIDQALASTDIEPVNTTGTGLGDDLLSGEGGGDNDEALFQVEVMPSFKGGDLTKFRDWVGKRTNYPKEAIEKKIRGTVFLTFIVEKDGTVSNVTVVKGVDPLLDNEAVKAISESPKWTPGLQRGQPVRVRFQIPLSFIY
jgi:protein TonB